MESQKNSGGSHFSIYILKQFAGIFDIKINWPLFPDLMCTLESFAADCDPVLREFSADRIYKVTAYKKVLWHGYRKRDQIRVIAADRFQHGILRNSGTEIDAVLAIIFKNISYHTCTRLV